MAHGFDGASSTGCGIGTLLDVSSQEPEDLLKGQFQPRQVYVGKTYVQRYMFGIGYQWIHIFWSDYDRTAYAATKLPYSSQQSVSSGAKLAAYIEANALGTITRTPPIHNPAHSERPVGQGDVTAYIWTLNNPDGITAWATKLGLIPSPTGTHLGQPTTKG